MVTHWSDDEIRVLRRYVMSVTTRDPWQARHDIDALAKQLGRTHKQVQTKIRNIRRKEGSWLIPKCLRPMPKTPEDKARDALCESLRQEMARRQERLRSLRQERIARCRAQRGAFFKG
jgi:nicotinamide mononucleotide adenylyltransferase